MKTTVEQIHDIAETLHSELINAGAINKKGEIVKPQMFLDIIEHKESELNKFYKEVESEEGVITDKYALNILENYLWNLKEMKETMSVNFDEKKSKDPTKKDPEKEMMAPSKPSAFKTGMKKLFGKIKSKINPTNSNAR